MTLQSPPGETLFFVHIPKCAGSSFRQVLKRWFGPSALFLDTHDAGELARAVERMAAPPLAIAGHMPFGLLDGLPLRPCPVSLVRHPLDRFASVWKHAARTRADPLHDAARELGLEAFYDFTLTDPRARRRTVAVQCQFLAGARSFEAARQVLEQRYLLAAPVERYEDFVGACAARFGRPARIPPPRNVSAEEPVAEDVRARLEPRIAIDHAEDLRLYEHVRQVFDARLLQLAGARPA
jgi:hypothetical protein